MRGSPARDRGLVLIDELVAEGATTVRTADVQGRLGLSPQAASNLLRRLTDEGLLERLRPGSYAIRGLGVLGTRAAAESLAIAVGAAFADVPHRIGYCSALDELGLLTHPARTAQVAATRRVRLRELSGRPLRTIVEPVGKIHVGAVREGPSWVSNLERALLDAAARPELGGGAATLAEALGAAASRADPVRLTRYAERLAWGAALRRIGSLVDRLDITGLSGKLHPLKLPTADLDLEPNGPRKTRWRDPRWWVRWNRDPNELLDALRQ